MKTIDSRTADLAASLASGGARAGFAYERRRRIRGQ
jgi:hypothetical protein